MRVLCLGGGWTGLHAARRLKPLIRSGQVELTVINRENFQMMHGFVAETLVGRLQPHQLLSPARRIFAPARFHNAEITRVDIDAKVVTTSRTMDGREFTLPYDHLILSLGARDDLDRYPGLAEHALRLRNFSDTFATRNHLITMLELAEVEPDPLERRRLLTFVVAGGGYGGVEVATELDDWLRSATRDEFGRLDPEEMQVVLVHSGDRILPELSPHHENLRRWAERYIGSATRIDVRTGTRVASATPDEVLLSDGSRIATRSIISSIGTEMSPLIEALDLPKDERGRVRTDVHGRVQGRDDIWAGGDCAAVPHPKGGSCPPLAVYAMEAGKAVGENIARTVSGRPLRPFTFTGLGDACLLGRRRAVAHLKGIPLYGVPAWIAWRSFALLFAPTWERRVRFLVDWALTPLFGRDITQLAVGRPVGMRRALYEPGQVIFRQGDVGTQLCLIWQGEVEVVRDGADGEERLATLGPGDHFGEMAVFQELRRTATVRAVTRVELIMLGRDEARTLGAAVREFGSAVRRLPGDDESEPITQGG